MTSWLISLPTRSVSVAVPATPVVIEIVAVLAPCAIVTGPLTLATAGFVLEIVTRTLAIAG